MSFWVSQKADPRSKINFRPIPEGLGVEPNNHDPQSCGDLIPLHRASPLGQGVSVIVLTAGSGPRYKIT